MLLCQGVGLVWLDTIQHSSRTQYNTHPHRLGHSTSSQVDRVNRDTSTSQEREGDIQTYYGVQEWERKSCRVQLVKADIQLA